MVFHEITREAIRPRRRQLPGPRPPAGRRSGNQAILDRLYGYEVSPVLWRKVLPRLSAGRVQSVATRLLVERERARIRFRVAAYWDIAGRFRSAGGSFGAPLVALDGARLASGRDLRRRRPTHPRRRGAPGPRRG